MHIEIAASFSYQLPEELITVKFDDNLASLRWKMDLFAFFLLTLFFAESSSGKNAPQCPQIKLRFGRVRYRQRGKLARFVCNTGYTLAGDRFSVCVQGEWDSVSPKCVRATCMNAKPPINGLIYPSLGGAVLNFYCKSHHQLRGPSITYCDGTRWDNPLPSCLPTNSTTPLSCDFERDDLCGWNHDLNHDFDWTRLNYATPSGSIGTGPAHDHTKGAGKDGYYMYVESSARNVNDVARLISPVYDRTDLDTCFEFYYHMYGVTTGDLRVYLKKVNQTWDLDPKNAIFAKNGNQGNKWFRAFLELGTVDDDYQIIIEGVRGSSYVSDIAIDDVRIIPNCTREMVEQAEAPTTTEESASSEPPIGVESCENRCSALANQSSEFLITCDCDEQCYEHSRCCPDYFDFCVLGTSPEDSVEETRTASTAAETPPSATTTGIVATTTRIASTATELPETTTAKKEDSKIVYVRPDDVADVPTEAPVKEIEPIGDGDGDKSFNQKIVVEAKTGESNRKTVIFAVGVVFGVLFGVVVMAFVARRYRLVRCGNLRRMNQSSNGDSQSDVRFLTGDEVLDLNLPAGYDTL
ncbi:uncharacterized protein BDFB_009419 [Asbolus verrucosus]|uniref:Uncharacterized protein n=1 Tax=Asbolus verrucosus TaxID=1661398 RepID=A0A482VA00_ASBVE|nr:uncharacterized protein BDFB_009419 [Asbolus verrucosus]